MFWQKSYRLEWYLIIWHYLNLYVYSISFIARHFLLWKLTGAKFNLETMFQQERNLKRLRRRQYDPLIIERTIGLVLGPSTALYGPFLKHCTLTKKAVGTLWRVLSKPPQRRQGPDLRPLLLLVGTPSAIRPELAFSRAEHSLPYSDVTIYIFAILYLSSMLYVCRYLWPLRLGWLLLCCLCKEVYLQIFKRVSFWLHGCCGEWEGWARRPGLPHQLGGCSYSNWPS